MLIPIRCFTCGAVIGNKWSAYQTLVDKYQSEETEKSRKEASFLDIVCFEEGDGALPITPEAKALADLHVTRYCCRRHFLGQVDMINEL